MVLAQIVGIVVFLIIIFALFYAFYQKNRRKRLLGKLVQEGSLPPPLENTLFFEGIATRPKLRDLKGNSVAFRALHIMKKSASVTRKVGLRSIEGFELVYHSGDFFVHNKNNQRQYKIGVNDYYEQLLSFTQVYAQSTKVLLTGEDVQRQNIIAKLETHNRAVESVMQVIFNYFSRKIESRASVSVPLYQKSSSTIKNVKPLCDIDFHIYEFVVGRNVPEIIEKLINEKHAADFLKERDELFVIELTIPLNHEVFVVGTYDSATNSITFRNPKIGLSVSYQDPTK